MDDFYMPPDEDLDLISVDELFWLLGVEVPDHMDDATQGNEDSQHLIDTSEDLHLIDSTVTSEDLQSLIDLLEVVLAEDALETRPFDATSDPVRTRMCNMHGGIRGKSRNLSIPVFSHLPQGMHPPVASTTTPCYSAEKANYFILAPLGKYKVYGCGFVCLHHDNSDCST